MINDTVVEMMRSFLAQGKMDWNLHSQFAGFVTSTLEPKNMFQSEVSSATTEGRKLNDMRQRVDDLINSAGSAFFDFIELEDTFSQENQKGHELILQLRPLSTSLNQVDLTNAASKMMDGLLRAHQQCR